MRVPKALPVQAQAAPAQPAAQTAYPRPPAAPPPAPAQPKTLPESLTDDERTLLTGLTQEGKVHIDSLIQALGWESHMVSRRLLVLEMQGLVRQWPGMYYSLT